MPSLNGVGRSDGFFDLSLSSEDPDYENFHVWNVVKLDSDECFLVDTIGIPTDVRKVENSAALLEQLGQADRDVF